MDEVSVNLRAVECEPVATIATGGLGKSGHRRKGKGKER
jgi:hypothetical protein